MRSVKLPILNAVASSLLAVGALGMATAISYSWDGLVDWRIAGEYLLGGIAGGWIGAQVAELLGHKKVLLNDVFIIVIVIVAFYMLFKEASLLL